MQHPITFKSGCWFCCLIYLFGVLRCFQHCTGHITTSSWKGRGNQYIEFTRVVYCKLLTNGKQLPAFPLKAVTGIEPRPQRWEARVLPLCHGSVVQHPASLTFLVWLNCIWILRRDIQQHPVWRINWLRKSQFLDFIQL